MSELVKDCLSNSYRTIYKGLDAICKCLNTLYNINNGGCCYVAYCIAQLLEKDSIPFDVVVFDDFNADSLSELDEECYHIAIRIVIDGEDCIINQGDFELDEITIFENVTSDDLFKYYKRFKWNEIYEIFRNKFIKYVITLLYENFTHSLRKRRSNCTSK